jgi:hypothetical protein
MIISDIELLSLVSKAGLIDENKFLAVATYAKNANISLVDALIEQDVVSDENLRYFDCRLSENSLCRFCQKLLFQILMFSNCS